MRQMWGGGGKGEGLFCRAQLRAGVVLSPGLPLSAVPFGTKKETLTLSSWQNFALDHVCDREQKVLWRRSDTAACALVRSRSTGLGSGTSHSGQREGPESSAGWQ